MKRILAAAAAVLMMLPLAVIPSASAINFQMDNPIHSEFGILINLDTDTVINEKNADTVWNPGPLVNIMTAVVVLENTTDRNEKLTLDPEVYSSYFADGYPYYMDIPEVDYPYVPTTENIADGDTLTVNDLLYCMMLTSSVKASQTLAYHVGGESVSNFVDMMNAKAAELGMTNTNFTNPTGMFDSEQYTTARDLATLTQYAVDNVPYFETIATTYSYHPSVPNDQNHENYASWYWTHSNIMMNSESEYFYPGAKGIKTANLEQIGRNIVVMASKDSKNYLAVLLNARFDDGEGNMTFYHIDDATAMFDWAFKHFSYKTILAESTEVGSLPVTLADGNDFVIARPKEEFKLFWYDGVDESLIRKEPENIVWYKDSLQAPVKKGEPLGVLTLEYNGEKLGEVEVVAVSDVKRSTVKYNLYAVKMFPKSKWLKKSLLIACIPCALYILICIYSFIVFRSKAKPIKPVYAVPKVEKKKRKKKQ